jgi:hypothetical protein
MSKLFTQTKQLALKALTEPKIRRPLLRGLAVVLVLQIYFVRELIAAEALFILGFIALMGVIGICYLLGTLGLKSIDVTETGLRISTQFARHSFEVLEVVARNSIRHLPSETTK